MKKKIIFIINPISGTTSKLDIPNKINHIIDNDKFEYVIKETQYAGHATEIAKEATRNNIDIVVAIGGDGTINETARALIHSNTALGIIPCGSGNGLARHLMLPIKVDKALEIINSCVIHDLDYGMINKYPFFCTCGMGFDAFISYKFSKSRKRGPISYIENVLKEGIKYNPETYTILNNSNKKEYKAFLISCANASQYGNNAYIAPSASMSDGYMNVTVMEPFRLIDAPQLSIDIFNKTLEKNPKIKTFKCKQLHIERNRNGYIHFDGEPIMAGKTIDIKLIPKGIKIIINPNADKNKRLPNKFQSATSDLFSEITSLRIAVQKQTTHMKAIKKIMTKKINEYIK